MRSCWFRPSSATGGAKRNRQPVCQRGPAPSGRTSIAAKQPAETLIGNDVANCRRVTWLRLDQVVVETLMWPLLVIVVNEFAECAPQMFVA